MGNADIRKTTPTALPILCVKSVSGSSKLLTTIFGWRSTHGGDEFDELVDEENLRVLWLHQLEAPEHARFADNKGGVLGRGVALYIFVDEIETVYTRTQAGQVEIVEDLAKNPNADFREFTFREPNGYFFTVAETPHW